MGEQSATLSASLDPLETNDDSEELTAYERCGCIPNDAFEHSGWRSGRIRTFRAMIDAGVATSTIDAFNACCGYRWVAAAVKNPAKYRVVSNRCHNRFCRVCSGSNAACASRLVAGYIKDKRVRFITLTLKSTDDPLATQLDRLRDCFHTLRHKKRWTDRVKGGIAFFEITFNAETRRWHPHLHILTEGAFFPHDLLKSLWHQITIDSSIVDIRAVANATQAARYVAKYATKGWNASVQHDRVALTEAITALKGRRLALVFGSWKGFTLKPDPDKEEWAPLLSLPALTKLAETGDTFAQDLLNHLRSPNENPTPGPAPPGFGHPPIDSPVPLRFDTDFSGQQWFLDDDGRSFASAPSRW